MITAFHYEDLTWPEVAALDRDIPLILPLGSGFHLESLANVLGNPKKVGLLPSFPFGWDGSGLQVREEFLSHYIDNLLDNLREDGFRHVFALIPQGIDIKLKSGQIHLPYSTTSPVSIPPDSDCNKVILLPIGHTEQHGLHLPLSTDTIIIEAICQKTAALISEQAYSMPVMPYGVSMHRKQFAGTLNAGGRAFEDFWIEVIDVLVARGFNRIFLLSGHGGNCSFLVNVVKYAGERHPDSFIATTFLYLTSPEGIAALEKNRQSKIGGMGHACELETSLILNLRPELVHMEKAVDEVDFVATDSYYMDWVEGGALIANPPWSDDTTTGAYGAGSLGTAEKGEIWLAAAIAEKIAQIEEIHEQQKRRSLRHNKNIRS